MKTFSPEIKTINACYKNCSYFQYLSSLESVEYQRLNESKSEVWKEKNLCRLGFEIKILKVAIFAMNKREGLNNEHTLTIWSENLDANGQFSQLQFEWEFRELILRKNNLN